MFAVLRIAFVVWLLFYPFLPIGPAIGYLMANLLGPPFVTASANPSGWRDIGPVTPSFVAVTIGLPWIIGAVTLAALTVLTARRRSSER